MAQVHRQAGQTQAADALLGQALKTFPDYNFSLEELAAVRMAQHRYPDAVELMVRRNRNFPSPASYLLAARAFDHAGKPAEASEPACRHGRMWGRCEGGRGLDPSAGMRRGSCVDPLRQGRSALFVTGGVDATHPRLSAIRGRAVSVAALLFVSSALCGFGRRGFRFLDGPEIEIEQRLLFVSLVLVLVCVCEGFLSAPLRRSLSLASEKTSFLPSRARTSLPGPMPEHFYQPIVAQPGLITQSAVLHFGRFLPFTCTVRHRSLCGRFLRCSACHRQ